MNTRWLQVGVPAIVCFLNKIDMVEDEELVRPLRRALRACRALLLLSRAGACWRACCAAPLAEVLHRAERKGAPCRQPALPWDWMGECLRRAS